MKKLSLLLTACLCMSVMGLTGCNTAKGFGQDLQKGGQNIQNAAEDSK